MVTVSSTAQVPALPEEVFAFLDTPANHERISPSITSVHDVERLPEGGHRAGYTYRLFGVPLRGTVEAVVHDPPRRLGFVLRGGIDGEMDWRLRDVDGGTRVTCEATFTVPGGPLATLFDPVVRVYNERELDETLARLRDGLEAT
ncbi:SRPBCC family protein [Salinigranum halophilum]|uniref:SRPBCC family protein n=1 Tax=Salinigranum halophilum TaxID=2565931 RepID=UPI0010A7B397|nr:SRPBCC family protein [Salinigranum halophilum]